MGLKESSHTTMAPLLLRNLVASLFIYADKSLLNLAERYKLLECFRFLVTSFFVLLLRILPSVFPSLIPKDPESYKLKPHKKENYVPAGCGDTAAMDSGIARALSQLLASVNDIPVSSRKYEVVRSLAERLIEENNKEDVEALREVNRAILSAAFERTLAQLEAAMMQLGHDQAENGCSGPGPVPYGFNMVLKAVRSVGEGTFAWAGKGRKGWNRSGISAEKLAAELLWLAQKLGACGYGEEAVRRWASASNLGWLALSAEPRLQGSLVKASAYLFKQAKDLGLEETKEGRKEQQRRTKMKMLMSWLPLLCRGSNGTDIPVLSTSERAELERVLEETIDMLEEEVEQEQVLSLWLHHYTYCPSSDWPNLHASYARWCTASRKLLILNR